MTKPILYLTPPLSNNTSFVTLISRIGKIPDSTQSEFYERPATEYSLSRLVRDQIFFMRSCQSKLCSYFSTDTTVKPNQTIINVQLIAYSVAPTHQFKPLRHVYVILRHINQISLISAMFQM